MLRKLTETEKEKVSRLWTISRKGKSICLQGDK